MTVGLGIFLAALVLAPVVLFGLTRDRWNWRRIVLWAAAAGLAASIIIAVSILWQSRIREETELSGISIGDSVSDVRFKKGNPDSEVFGYIWAYRHAGDRTSTYVEFHNSLIDRIHIFPIPDYGPSFRGLGSKSKLKEMTETFGKPSCVSESQDSLWRLVSFSAYNIAFLLHRDSTVGMAIFNGKRSRGLEIDDKIIQAHFELQKLAREKQEAEEAERERERQRLKALRDAETARKSAEKAEAERIESERKAQVEKERQASLAQQRIRQQMAAEAMHAQQQKERARLAQIRSAELAKWQQLRIGMTKPEVERLLGRPQKVWDIDGGIWFYPPLPNDYHEPRVEFGGPRVKAFDAPR